MKESIKSYKENACVLYFIHVNEYSVVYDLQYFTSLNVHETNESSYQSRDIIYLKHYQNCPALRGLHFPGHLKV
jgi:hypothetical protein